MYVCLHQYELSHFQHVYNILALSLNFHCSVIMYSCMYPLLCCIILCIFDFSEGPMADERKLNGSPSLNGEYFYYYY